VTGVAGPRGDLLASISVCSLPQGGLMSTAHDFRRIALSLDGTTSAPHFHRTAFKVARIFATLALKAALEPAWQHALPRKPASRTRRQMR
jgi:hypothetical protein